MIVVILPPILAKVCSAVTAMLRAIIVHAPDYFVTLDMPEELLTRLYHVPQVLTAQALKANYPAPHGVRIQILVICFSTKGSSKLQRERPVWMPYF